VCIAVRRLGASNATKSEGKETDFGARSFGDLGRNWGKDALYEAILEPSAGISFGYEGWQIQLKNGDDAGGLIVSETADETGDQSSRRDRDAI